MSTFDKFFKGKTGNDFQENRIFEVAKELEIDISTECSIQINWSQSIEEAPKMYDCSFDDAMSG
jgi:hypothetical protein